jgi:FAD-dependent oxidoreductase domain-containing protein 1
MVEYDAVIVGAGIIGLSTAYHIKNRHPNAQVLVVDKLNAAGQANTARSAGAFRCLFYSHTNFVLADSSAEFYRYLQDDLRVNLKLRWTGYLWFFDEEGYRQMQPVLKDLDRKDLEYSEYDKNELAEKLGVQTNLTDDEEAQLMGLANIHKGVFIPKAGLIDVDSLVQFYESKFLKLGGKIQYGTEVENIVVEPFEPLGMFGEPFFWQDSRAVGIRTDQGMIRAKKTIVAAGVWIPSLLDPLGIECYIKPKKRQVFSVKANTEALKKLLWTKSFSSVGCVPFTILPKPSVYFKPAPEEDAFWLSYGDEFPRAFELEEDPQPEENFYQYGIYQVLMKYFPQFKDCQPLSAFAGLYAINTLDGQPMIFEENDLMVVGGASGSGIMKADAIGRIAAALCDAEEHVLLYGDRKFRVSDLGIKSRHVEPEKLVI